MRWSVFGCRNNFVVCFYSWFFFVLYLYSRRAHKTHEHVFHCCRGMCAAIIQKDKHEMPHGHAHRHTQATGSRST